MIKFFRRIRQKLVMESKASKYLLYAIGEIVLVVIGILIALQINNWNEDRKLKTREVSAMREIVDNLKYDIVRCERNIEMNVPIINGLDSLRTAVGNAMEGENEASNIYFYALKYGSDFSEAVINRTTYEELANTGLIKQIDNRELVQDISDYYERISTTVSLFKPGSGMGELKNMHKKFISYNRLDGYIGSFDLINEATFSPDYDYNEIRAMGNLDLLKPIDLSLTDYYNEIAYFEIDLKTYMFYMSWTANNATKLIERIEKEYDLKPAHQ